MDKKISMRELIRRGGRLAMVATMMGGASSIVTKVQPDSRNCEGS